MKTRRSKYRFNTLTKRGKRINMRTRKPEKVRAAAYQYALYHGWRISAHMTPQGVTLTRVA